MAMQVSARFQFENRDEVGGIYQGFILRAFIVSKLPLIGPLGKGVDAILD